MNGLIRISAVGLAALCMLQAQAQELSTAGYIGSVDGAAQACVEAFPHKASVYKDSLYRSVKCHLAPAEFAQWHKELSRKAPHSAQYEQGYLAGKASLARTSNSRKEQCASLERLVCSAGTKPDFK